MTTTRRDLVEAYSFSRRRLVTAFISGAPGGGAVEPRPGAGRTVVAGVAFAVLVVAGAAVTRTLSPGLAEEEFSGQVNLGRAAQVTGPGR